MEFRVVIPARYASTRLPGKVLLDIAGKSMLQHVYERAVASGAETVVIATDDEKVEEAAQAFGAQVCSTSGDHQSGTERLSEAVEALEYDQDEIVVCVQGDEPLIEPTMIRQVAQDLSEHDNVKVVSLCQPIENVEELFNPHVVKVVLNHRGYAMYFSRAAIPWERDAFSDPNARRISGEHYRHIGLYAYRVGFIREYMEMPSCPFAELEKLEQLRILWNGVRIHMSKVNERFLPGVDTAEDLERVREYFKNS